MSSHCRSEYPEDQFATGISTIPMMTVARAMASSLSLSET
jgi:hypothetical protein